MAKPKPSDGQSPELRRERVRQLASSGAARLESARTTVPAVDAAWVTWSRDRQLAGSLLSGALAYRLFVWLLPVALLLSGVLGFLGGGRDGAAEDSARSLGMSGYIRSTVSDAASQAEEGRWFIVTLGAIALYTSSVAGARAIRDVHAVVWDQPLSKLPRPPLAAAAFLGLFLVAISVTVLAREARDQSVGVGLGVTIGICLAYAMVWLAASLLLPHADAPWTALIPGAVLVATGIQVLHLVTVYYLAGRLDSASELYGGLGAAGAILLWLYLMGRVIVGAAVLNSVLWRRYGASEAPKTRR